MVQKFIEGGWGMWPVLGLAALGMALRYAVTADARLRGAVELLGRSVLFFSLAAFTTGVIATGSGVFRYREANPQEPLWELVFVGLVESTNGLALVYMALAVGARREAVRDQPGARSRRRPSAPSSTRTRTGCSRSCGQPGRARSGAGGG